MWNPFASKTHEAMAISVSLRQELGARGGSAIDLDSLKMTRHKGVYSGRNVVYFRVYDPMKAPAGRRGAPRHEELTPEFVLHEGFVDGEATVFYGK